MITVSPFLLIVMAALAFALGYAIRSYLARMLNREFVASVRIMADVVAFVARCPDYPIPSRLARRMSDFVADWDDRPHA